MLTFAGVSVAVLASLTSTVLLDCLYDKKYVLNIPYNKQTNKQKTLGE